jgi:hypothetical protein
MASASTRETGTESYALAGPDVVDLMRATSSFLTRILAGRASLIDAPRDEVAAAARRSAPVAA